MLKFKNAPVAEVIAAIQWQPSSQSFHQADETLNELLLNFTDKAAEIDFCQSERLIPPQVPVMPFKPIFKYNKIKEKTYFYQLGDGIFSAHAIPPYESWEEFKPIIKNGIELLIGLMPEKTKGRPVTFESAFLRYIDIFKKEIFGDIKFNEFTSRILKIEPPKYLKDKSLINPPSIQDIMISTLLENNMKLLTIAKEFMDINSKEQVIILDNTITASNKIDTSADIINAMDEAHKIISDIFIEITKPIHKNMGAYDA